MNTRKIYQMHVTSVRDLTPSVRELVMATDPSEEFTFKAGQFVMLHVPQNEPKPALRAYSIASTDQNKKGFSLLFKYVENGKASEYVWKLKGDETLQFTGPFGKVFFQEPPTEQIVFFNTGTGLSQHLSYLESKKHLYPHLKYHMFFGVRNESEIYYQEHLQKLKDELPNFSFHYVLSRPPETWKGLKGYVQNHLDSTGYETTPTTFYLCGNGGMIKELKQKLLVEKGWDPKKFWAEAFD